MNLYSLDLNRVEPKFEPFLRPTRPDWTRFLTLRANQTQLNLNFGSKIGFNPKKRAGLAALLWSFIYENQGLEKSRSISNPRKISGSVNLDFFFQVSTLKKGWVFVLFVLLFICYCLGLCFTNRLVQICLEIERIKLPHLMVFCCVHFSFFIISW